MSAKEVIRNLILEFAEKIESLEPFNTKLLEFKLKLKSEIILILSQVKDKNLKEEEFKNILEGINEAVDEISKKLDFANEKLAERYKALLETLNEILKELYEVDDVDDKHELSQLSSKIAKLVEKINLELKSRRGGPLAFLRRLIYGG
ncbi:MAG: hypothetical protein GXO04_05895 [Aquificae bacterium]|nr:hypothetical protein [Aquificota bacterium]